MNEEKKGVFTIVDDKGKETFLQMVKDATEKMYKVTGINPRYKVA